MLLLFALLYTKSIQQLLFVNNSHFIGRPRRNSKADDDDPTNRVVRKWETFIICHVSYSIAKGLLCTIIGFFQVVIGRHITSHHRVYAKIMCVFLLSHKILHYV